jgi:beta-lactamase superfamily II metal-dependent hydrolase
MKQTGGEKAVIAAWIFTHFHQDHNGGFVEFVQRSAYMENVTIRSLIYNNPHQQVIDLSSPLDQDNMSKWPTLIKSTGATLYQARTGQKYTFANAKIEMLFTYEDMMPFWITHDRSNPTSLIFSITIDGTKFMMTGDASREGMESCIERYGSYLKSDFVQLSHHGHGDGGSPVNFYQLVDADTVYVPGRSTATAEKWACDNAKKVYYLKKTVTLAIPIVIE